MYKKISIEVCQILDSIKAKIEEFAKNVKDKFNENPAMFGGIVGAVALIVAILVLSYSFNSDKIKGLDLQETTHEHVHVHKPRVKLVTYKGKLESTLGRSALINYVKILQGDFINALKGPKSSLLRCFYSREICIFYYNVVILIAQCSKAYRNVFCGRQSPKAESIKESLVEHTLRLHAVKHEYSEMDKKVKEGNLSDEELKETVHSQGHLKEEEKDLEEAISSLQLQLSTVRLPQKYGKKMRSIVSIILGSCSLATASLCHIVYSISDKLPQTETKSKLLEDLLTMGSATFTVVGKHNVKQQPLVVKQRFCAGISYESSDSKTKEIKHVITMSNLNKEDVKSTNYLTKICCSENELSFGFCVRNCEETGRNTFTVTRIVDIYNLIISQKGDITNSNLGCFTRIEDLVICLSRVSFNVINIPISALADQIIYPAVIFVKDFIDFVSMQGYINLAQITLRHCHKYGTWIPAYLAEHFMNALNSY